MVFNINYQICAFILVIIVISMFHSKKRLRMDTDKVFGQLLFACLISVVLDIFSVFIINYKERVSHLLYVGACKIYALSICSVIFFVLLYILVLYNTKINGIKAKIVIFLMPLIIEVAAMFVLPLESYINVELGQIYTYGSFIYLTYGICFFYLGTAAVYTILYRKKIEVDKLKAICFFWLAISGTGLLQFVDNYKLLVSLAMGISTVYMYFCLENPSEHFARISGVFNFHALRVTLAYLYAKGGKFSVYSIVLKDYAFIYNIFGYENMDNMLSSIADFLNSIKGIRTFISESGQFYIVCDDVIESVKISEIIRNRFEQKWEIGDVNVVLSTLICELPDSKLVQNEDELLAILRYFVDTSMNKDYILIDAYKIEKKCEEDAIVKNIRKAVEKHEIILQYQPIYSVNEKKYTSLEALIRIKDEDGNLILPDVFIPLAEKNGMVVTLGVVIFERVCSFIRRNDLEQYGIEKIDINLSIVQSMQENLSDRLIEIMKANNVNPNKIRLEISEVYAGSTNSLLESNIEKLYSKGVAFALDDYGRGSMNLTNVSNIDYEMIKIDNSFVWSYFENEKMRNIFKFTVAVIKVLNLKVVVKGIETEQQYVEMLSNQVDYIQGYYMSKPINENRVIEFLKNNNK